MQTRGFFASLGIIVFMLMTLPLLAQDNNGGTGISAFATNTPIAPAQDQSAQPTLIPTVNPQDVVVNDDAADDTSATIEDLGEPVVLSLPDECVYVAGQTTSQACIEFMNQHPEPEVTEINPDGFTLNQYSFWRVGPEAVTTYASPGGAAVGTIPQGFNFVNAVNETDTWIQSETGEWISKNDGYYVAPTYFRGVLLPDDWQLPFGWILDTTGIYASKFPGGPSDSATGLVPLHYERFNIFAEALDSEGWTWYLVGPDQWVKQIYMTVIKPTERPDGVTGRWVASDLFEQSLVAYEGNRPIFATLISTGLLGSETNEGLFEVWARLDRDAMSGATGAPNAYALQSVPWVQYFDSDISLHGTYWHDFFGYRRSRGCVNLSISDAKWVYDFLDSSNAEQDAPMYVYVHSSGEYR